MAGIVKTQDAQFFATARISENMVTTPEGFLLCIGVPIARTGELLYAEGELVNEDGDDVIEAVDGKVTIVRDEDALFDPAAMASFEGKSITIGHPKDFVNPQNWMQVAVGHMQNIRRGTGADADKLLADLLIVAQAAIDMVKAGLREVSLGYDAAYEQTDPGYGVQTGIVGNHVALVRKGRNGSEVAVRDSAPEFKPKGNAMNAAKQRIMKLLGRAVDEAMPDTPPATAKDEDGGLGDRLTKIEDALVALAGGNGTSDADTPPAAAKDELDPELAQRLSTIEAALEKLLAAKNGESAVVVDEAPPSGDTTKDNAGVVMCKDAATLSAAEILVPGIANSATLVKDVLTKFGETTDGAAVLKTFDSIKDETAKLLASAEVMKVSRQQQLSYKPQDFQSLRAGTADGKGGPMSPEAINEANAKRYGQ